MRRPQIIADELSDIRTIGMLTGVFRSIASMQIAQIKHQVQASKGFFDELWNLYSQLRVDPGEGFRSSKVTTDKTLLIAITAEGGFSGDIDQKLITWMLQNYDANTMDVICIGHHGAIQLAQAGVSVTKYFKLPGDDQQIELEPMIDLIERYKDAMAYYQTYVSLAVQDVKRIELNRVVQQLVSEQADFDETISKRTYILEPSEEEVIQYLESTMLGVALAQVILESKLAQHASRFRAMASAHDKSKEMQSELRMNYYRSKRALSDERLRELMAGLKHSRSKGTA